MEHAARNGRGDEIFLWQLYRNVLNDILNVEDSLYALPDEAMHFIFDILLHWLPIDIINKNNWCGPNRTLLAYVKYQTGVKAESHQLII